MDRVLKTKDINFIKTLLEYCPDKVKNILTVNKQPEKRISDILALAKKNNINISFDQISRLEASYSPREVEDINSLEKILSNKKSPIKGAFSA